MKNKLKLLYKWFEELDESCFNSFLSDKNIILKVDKRITFSYAVAYPAQRKLGFNKEIFERVTKEELKDTLLHEMIHIYLGLHRMDYNYYGDNSPEFRKWSIKLNCPVVGRTFDKRHYKEDYIVVCIDCDEITGINAKQKKILEKKKNCPKCLNRNTKIYKIKKR